MAKVTTEMDGAVAVLTLANPPVNALGHDVRVALLDAFRAAAAHAVTDALVIIASGRTFPAGGDISEFKARPKDPWLPEILNEIEASEKPVIAALHGTVLGGGFELALAAHYRVALTGTQVGLPEVELGILPGAGGTQRAPRLLGAKTSLDMMLSGRMYDVSDPQVEPALDRVVSGDLRAEAIGFANEVLSRGLGPRRTRDRRTGFADMRADQGEVNRRRAEVKDAPEPAHAEIVAAVEAAGLLPFEVGLNFERAAFDTLVASPHSKALRHLFFAERRAPKFRETVNMDPPRLARIGVSGQGVDMAGLAALATIQGLDVLLHGSNRESLSATRVAVQTHMDLAARSATVRLSAMARLDDSLHEADLNHTDLVLAGSAMRAQSLIPVIGAGRVAVLDRMPGSGQTDSPTLIIAPPVQAIRAAEIVVPEAADSDAVAALVALLKRLGKIPFRVEATAYSATHRLMAVVWEACDRIVLAGTSPYEVDKALVSYGFRRGPYAVADRLGLDKVLSMREAVAGHIGRDMAGRAVLNSLIAEGRLGRNSGAGFYMHEVAGGAKEDRIALDLIAACRTRPPVSLTNDDIAQAIHAALCREALQLWQDHAVARPSDLDVLAVHALGLPRWRGGILQEADHIGMLELRRRLDRFAALDAYLWREPESMDHMIRNAWKFADLGAELL